MKYVLVGLALVAAVAALIVRPPQFAAGPAAASAPSTPGGDGSAEGRFTGLPARPRVARVVVYVAGEVRKPGVYPLAADARGADALTRAGGPLPDADLVAVNLAAPLHDGDEIAVPKIGAPSGRGRSVHSARSPRRGHGSGSRRRPPTPEPAMSTPSIDINAADATELEAVPGIGPALAARIVAYREENGPFTSLDEVADVAGITPRIADELERTAFVR